MELRVNEVAIPQEIKILNFEELKTELKAKADYYGSLAYTDEQIKDAKSDRAQLNKFKNTVNSERIRKEKEYMEPFNEFKSQVNELIAIVEKSIAVIDERIAAYSDEQKAKKQKAIEELFASMGFQNFVTLEKIQDPKWLNASVSMKNIEDQMRSKMYEIGNDVLRISQFAEFSFEAMEAYKERLLMDDALIKVESERNMAQKKAAAKAAQSASVHEPTFPVRFEAIVTEEQAKELAAWFTERHIQFKQIR